MTKLTKVLAILLALTLTAAACSDDDDDAGNGDDISTDDGTTDDDTTDDDTTDGDADQNTLGVTETDLGLILTDPVGQVLYATDDDAGADVPTCVEDCAAKWPPVIIFDDPYTLADDVAGLELGSIVRDNGTEQLTVNGLPVYTFVDDAPGEANCQGVGDVWWAVGSDGLQNRTPPA